MAIDRLITRINELKAPVVVGLDPTLEILPKQIKNKWLNADLTPLTASTAFIEFNKTIIDNIADIVPAVKLQVAMYEMFGALGIDAYIKTADYAKKKGMIVIGDIKRGDISSTADAYARAHLGRVQIESTRHKVFGDADFVTVNAYMGHDTVAPFLEDCDKHDKGIFVLVKTSNPSSGDIQDLKLENGKPLYEHMGTLVKQWGKYTIGTNGFSKVCAVVGATYAEEAKNLRKLMPNTFFLVPGYGAQGGKAKDMAVFFTRGIEGAIVNSSRGIIGAHKQDKYSTFGEENYGEAARAAAQDMITDIIEAL